MNNTNKRIAILVDGFEPGGTDEVAALVASQLDDQNRIVTVISDGSELKLNFLKSRLPKSTHIIECKLTPALINRMYGSSLWIVRKLAGAIYQYCNLAWAPLIFVRIAKLLLNRKIDFLIINSGGWPGPRSTLPVLLACLALGTKQALVIHNYVATTRRYTLLQTLILEHILNITQVPVVCVSNDLRNSLEKKTKLKNIIIIRNAIREDFFSRPRDPRHTDERASKTRLISVGTLDKRRSQITVLEALIQLPSSILNELEYWIVGTGTEFSNLKIFVEKYGLVGIVKFHGFVPDPLPLLDQCDIYINPVTSHESFGLGMYEAMSRGLPVLASDVCAISECVVDGVNGEKFAAGNSKRLATIIERLIIDQKYQKKLSEGALKTSKSAMPAVLRGSYLNLIEYASK